jgi:hypothetical protein
MKRDAKKLILALLTAFVFVVSGAELIAQSPQTSGSDKSQAPAATSSASAAAKPTPAASASPAGDALVWKDQAWQIYVGGGCHQGRI